MWRRSVVALSMLVPTAALVGLAGAARANEATTLRVVSVARSAGGATVVVSVPTRLAATAAEPGAFRIATAQGQVVTPGVAALDPASTAVGVVVDVPPDASPDQARQVVGTAAELVRSVDPATPLTVAFTRGVDPPLPLGTDRAAQLAALAHVAQPVVAARGTAVQAAAAQLVVGNFVAPMIVVVDTATVVEPVAAAGAIRVVSIPVAAPVDPISLVDDAVALTQGRFALTIPGAGAGALQITLGQGTGALSATVAAAPATGTPTTVATSALRPPTTPTVAGARVTPPAAPASSAASGSSAARVTPKAPATAATGAAGTSSIGVVVGVVLGVVAAGAAGVLIVRRRRPGDEARGDTEVAVTLAPAHADPSPPAPVVRGYYYTDFTDAPPAPQESPTPPPVVEANGHAVASGADEVYARRLRVLALAEELGNISEACRVVGVSRRSFYEWKRLAEEQGPEALYPKRSRSPDS